MFVARLKAGERGARMIEVEDLLAALVLEDQGMSEKIFSNNLGLGDGDALVSKVPSHLPFFPPEIAEHLLSRIKDMMPQSDPVGLTDEIPVSAALARESVRFGESDSRSVPRKPNRAITPISRCRCTTLHREHRTPE
jgi:hypothetical protein